MSDETKSEVTPNPKPVEPARQAETPEQTIAALREALAKANEEAKTNRLKANELDSIKTAQMSDLERAQAEKADLEKRLQSVEAAALRRSVALAKGLPADLVDRLRGESEQELAADADALLALVNQPRSPIPDPTMGPQGLAPSTPEQAFVAFANSLSR